MNRSTTDYVKRAESVLSNRDIFYENRRELFSHLDEILARGGIKALGVELKAFSLSIVKGLMIEYFVHIVSDGLITYTELMNHFSLVRYYNPVKPSTILMLYNLGSIPLDDVRYAAQQFLDKKENILSVAVSYLFDSMTVDELISDTLTPLTRGLGWYTVYLLQYIAIMSEEKTYELASALVKKYGCEQIFNLAALNTGYYNTGNQLLVDFDRTIFYQSTNIRLDFLIRAESEV